MPRSAGTFTLYTPGNPVVTGTTISSAWANNTLNDIGAALTQSLPRDGTAPPTANIPMGGFKQTGLGPGSALTDSVTFGQVQNSADKLITGVAGADTITGSIVTPTLAAYATGQELHFVAAATNTGAATININSLGAKAITKNGATPLVAGDLVIGAAYSIFYDGTQFQVSAFVLPGQVQAQTFTAFTTAGTTTAYTLTPSPALTALATNQRFQTTFNAANTTTTPTLAISGLAAKNLKVYDSAGTKQNPAIGAFPANWTSDVLYDGTDYIVLDALPALSASVPVRQTVLSSAIDSNGQPTFLATAVTLNLPIAATATPIRATAANGFSATGQVDVTGSLTADTTILLPASQTSYVYFTVAGGVLTPGSGLLAPIYQWGGSPSVVNGQFTFVIQTMIGYVGNGATATQTNRVYCGQAATSGTAVTSVVSYALEGRYAAPLGTAYPAAATQVLFNHNLGLVPLVAVHRVQCITTEAGYVPGDFVDLWSIHGATGSVPVGCRCGPLTVSFAHNMGTPTIESSISAVNTPLTLARWNYVPSVIRGW